MFSFNTSLEQPEVTQILSGTGNPVSSAAGATADTQIGALEELQEAGEDWKHPVYLWLVVCPFMP